MKGHAGSESLPPRLTRLQVGCSEPPASISNESNAPAVAKV